jgi:hypothetical protein
MQVIDRKAPPVALAAVALFGIPTSVLKLQLGDVDPVSLAGGLYPE